MRDSVGTMEGLLAPENRQSGMSAFSSDTRGKHLSQSTMGSPIIGVQPASPVLGNGGFKETGGGGYGQVPQS